MSDDFNKEARVLLYKKMIEVQKNKCKICGVNLKTGEINHNHKTGEIRGLLCHYCNTGIGYLKKNPYIMFKTIKYLRREL